MKILKITGLVTVALALCIVIAAGLAAALIKPDEYRPRLEALVQKATGRKLVLQGSLSLSVFPGLSVTSGPAELHDDATFGSAPFVRIESAKGSVALLPLLSGRVEIAELALSGLRVKLVVNTAGKANWDMRGAPSENAGDGVSSRALAPDGGAGGKALPPIRVGALSLKDAALTYTDMRGGTDLALTLHGAGLDNLAPGEKTGLSVRGEYTDGFARLKLPFDLKASFVLPESPDKTLAFTLAGTLDKTAFTGDGAFGLPPGGRMLLTGAFSLGDINVDPYLAAFFGDGKDKAAPGPAAARPGRSAAGDEAEAAAFLRRLSLDLDLKAASVIVNRLPLKDIRARVKADDGRLAAAPVTLGLADGTVSAVAEADAAGNAVAGRVRGEIKNAQAGQIVRALSGKESLTGVLNLTWDLTGSGLAWPVLSRSLAGKAAMTLTHGRAPAFQIIPEDLPGLPARRADIAIERFGASWDMAKGIARCGDLALRATAMTADGGGTFNLPDRTLHYRVNVRLPAVPVVPAVIDGPLESPRYSVDKVEFLRNAARGILESPGKAGQGLEKTGEGLGKAVEGIFRKR